MAIKRSRNKNDAINELVGYSVMGSYANHRNYVIDDIDFKKKPTDKFFY